MLQRIQTIFLTIIAVLMIIFLFVNIWNKKSLTSDEQITLNAMKMLHTQNGQIIAETTTIWLAMLAIVCFILALISIFSFNNRIRQMQFGLFLSIGIGAILGLIVYYSFAGENQLIGTQKGSFGLGLLIPAMALICNSLANRFIRKDEELVRSTDRLR